MSTQICVDILNINVNSVLKYQLILCWHFNVIVFTLLIVSKVDNLRKLVTDHTPKLLLIKGYENLWKVKNVTPTFNFLENFQI